MSINPVFDQRPKEGAAIGIMVVSFGELELMCGLCAGLALDGDDKALRAIYRSRSTRGRIDIADALMRLSFFEVGLQNEYIEIISAVLHCLKIRNQYAHCHWAPSNEGGVFFTDLEKAAERQEGFDYHYKYVDMGLLQEQLDYFSYAKQCLSYMENEFRFRKGTLRSQIFPMPKKLIPPTLHRPESLHIPHWLHEDQKRQHSERALGIEATAPQRERPPSVPRLTEGEWLAKYRKEGRSPETGAE
jgi:hypothetical protein